MLQNRVVPSSLSSTVPPDLASSLERTLANERLRVLKRTFSLPDSLQSFLVFVLILILVCGALIRLSDLEKATRRDEPSTPRRLDSTLNVALLPFNGWHGSFFGDLHMQGSEGVQFFTQLKVILSRWENFGHRNQGW